MPEEKVHTEIAELEKAHIICGYHTLVDWNKISDEDVTALVELRVTPQGGDGYEKLADKIKDFPQVVMLYLMSGAYDFMVMVKGKTLRKSRCLCPASWRPLRKYKVQNTTTHFTLTKYKESG